MNPHGIAKGNVRVFIDVKLNTSFILKQNGEERFLLIKRFDCAKASVFDAFLETFVGTCRLFLLSSQHKRTQKGRLIHIANMLTVIVVLGKANPISNGILFSLNSKTVFAAPSILSQAEPPEWFG